MKTTDEIIKENIGLSLESGQLTPMDKGECQYCMNKYLEEYKSDLKHLIAKMVDLMEREEEQKRILRKSNSEEVMNNANLVEGIKIIAKYVDSEQHNFATGHDQIWFCDYDKVTDENDVQKLIELGWFEDEDSWSAFV